MEWVVDMSWCNQFYMFQYFDMVLCLFGFGCFSVEMVDVVLQMCYMFLLIFIYCLLLCQVCGVLNFKCVVVVGVFEQSLLFDMDNFIYYWVKKIVIVGD